MNATDGFQFKFLKAGGNMIRSFPIHSQAYKLEDVILDNGISNDLKLFFVHQAQLISDAKLKEAQQEVQMGGSMLSWIP